MRLKTGGNITRGISVPALDRSKRWHFIPRAKAGDHVQAGDIIGVVQENEVFEHKIMIPYGIEGTLIDIFEGQYTIEDTIARVETRTGSGTTRVHDLTMIQKWPVRRERPYKEKMAPGEPLITGQRIIDTLFPIALGGVAAIPGPSEAGKP